MMGSYEINPDNNDRQLEIVSAYPFIHTTVPTDIRMTTFKDGDSIDILMVIKYPLPSMTTLDRN
jgi:hypothetical protein